MEGLRHQAKADPENADGPEAVLEAVDRPLVLCVDRRVSFFAEGVHHGDRNQQQGEQTDGQGLDFQMRTQGHRVLAPGAAAFEQICGATNLDSKLAAKLRWPVAGRPVTQEGEFPRIGRRKADASG